MVPGADDTAFGQTSFLLNDIGEHIDGIGDDDDDRIIRVLHNALGNLARDGDIALCEIETSLPRLSSQAGGDDDDLCIGTIRIIALAHRDLFMEGKAVVNIQRAAFCAIDGDIDHDDFRSGAAHGKGIDHRFADSSSSNDNNLVLFGSTHAFIPSNHK